MPHRLRRASAVLLVVVLAFATQASASAQPEVELEQARERAADLADRVVVAEQRLAEAREAVADLEDELRLAGDELAAAQAEEARAAESAELARRRADRARADLAAAEEEVEANLTLLAAFASETYKYGASNASPTLMALRSLTSSADGADLADSLQAMRLGLREQRRVVEEATVLRTRTRTLTAAAEAEEAAEQGFLDDAEVARDRAGEAHARVTQLMADASAAEARRSDRLIELDEARQGVDREIADLEAEVERERAERERAEREQAEREQAERERAERERAERERLERERAAESRPSAGTGGSSSGGTSGGSSGRSDGGSGGSGGSTPVRPGPASGLVTVGGITVAAELGPQLKALLDAARADGIVLGGSGYRSPESQAALRRANGCPDVWTSPASSCRVPTAIPGNSEHEKGLAVDFTYQGRTICFPSPASRCHGNAGFDWLKANAGRYGLRNLPSEAWHWSTTGR